MGSNCCLIYAESMPLNLYPSQQSIMVFVTTLLDMILLKHSLKAWTLAELYFESFVMNPPLINAVLITAQKLQKFENIVGFFSVSGQPDMVTFIIARNNAELTEIIEGIRSIKEVYK